LSGTPPNPNTVSALTAFEALLRTYLSLLDNLATFLFTFVLVYVLGRTVVVPLFGLLFDYRGTDRTLRAGLERLLSFGVIAGGLVLGLSLAGLDFVFERAAILVAAFTVALGFAAQNVVGNLVSGVFIVTDRSFNIGDWIRWNDQEGVIEDISFRSTRVRTFDGEVITVPNSALTANAVTNAVLNGRLRLTVPVRVGYEEDLDTVVRVLADAAAERPDVLDRPEPAVRVTELGEAVEVVTSMWIGSPDPAAVGRIRSEYAREIVTRLREAGVDLGSTNARALEEEIGMAPRLVATDGSHETDP
jgi:small conductance mechanosensitive channel